MTRLTLCGLLLALALLMAAAPALLAQAGGAFALAWHVVATGGGAMSGGAYSLTGSAGQAGAGLVATGGPYSLRGGVWGDADTPEEGNDPVQVYLPHIVR